VYLTLEMISCDASTDFHQEDDTQQDCKGQGHAIILLKHLAKVRVILEFSLNFGKGQGHSVIHLRKGIRNM